MKRNFKTILFCLILVLICPFVLSACGEVSFEDTPYVGSGADALTVIRDFNSSGDFMINRNVLRVKYETVNEYTFYKTTTTEQKTVKDVITTTLSSDGDVPAIAVIDTKRYVNNKIESVKTDTYVKTIIDSGSSTYANHYSYIRSYGANNEIQDKDKTDYDSTFKMIDFFKSTIYEINPEEIESISEKTYKDVTYYRLSSGISSIVEDVKGIEVVNDRFIEDENLQQDPQLFKIMTKSHHDAVENYYYECAKNDAEYATYYTIHYDIYNRNREKYLSTSSVTKLVQYGESVRLSLPEDIDEYTAYGFNKVMQKEGSYITYSTLNYGQEGYSDRVVFSVAKVGKDGKDFVVRQDQYVDNRLDGTVNYYVVNNKENDYTTFLVNPIAKTLTRSEFKLPILYFDFSLRLASKAENNYRFGEDKAYTIVGITNGEVSSITTSMPTDGPSQEITLYLTKPSNTVPAYGKDYTLLPANTFITNFDDYSTTA